MLIAVYPLESVDPCWTEELPLPYGFCLARSIWHEFPKPLTLLGSSGLPPYRSLGLVPFGGEVVSRVIADLPEGIAVMPVFAADKAEALKAGKELFPGHRVTVVLKEAEPGT